MKIGEITMDELSKRLENNDNTLVTKFIDEMPIDIETVFIDEDGIMCEELDDGKIMISYVLNMVGTPNEKMFETDSEEES